jgi:1,4-dihydroxy-6-naphthoate synthase
VGRRALGGPLLRRVDALVRRSLEASRARPGPLSGYVRCHAQEMDEAVMRQHIALYVNDFSLGLGPAGLRAVETLLEVWRRANPGEAISPGVLAADLP